MSEIVLFTRDLRVHDHPPLAAASRSGAPVVPLFVVDDVIVDAEWTAPHRLTALFEALADLRAALGARGAPLVVRRGPLATIVEEVAALTRARALHVADEESAYGRRRMAILESVVAAQGIRLQRHPPPVVVRPGAVRPAGGGHYRVFGAYARRWDAHEPRAPVPAPRRLVGVATLDPGPLWPLDRRLPASSGAAVAERDARRRLDAWLAGPPETSGTTAPRGPDAGGTRLSAALHLGSLSPVAMQAALDPGDPRHTWLARQLCWRDFAYQLLAAHPELPRRALRSEADRPRICDPRAPEVVAWVAGRTGYPVVDAGMRQLRAEGWMPNRVRMVVASFLTKHLGVDWRIGAAHFLRHLVDGDLATNTVQWQWVAGVGTDTRPGRLLNPTLQARRHDPTGAYVRRHVPELRGLAAPAIIEPWRYAGAPGYPPPIVDHETARAAFLTWREEATT